MITAQAYGSADYSAHRAGSYRGPTGPEVRRAVEEEIHGCVQAAADLRARFQAGVTAATRDLFESAGLPELLDLRWHDQPRDTGFVVQSSQHHFASPEPVAARRAHCREARIGPASDARRYLQRWPAQPRQQVHADRQRARDTVISSLGSARAHGSAPKGAGSAVTQAVLDEVRAADESVTRRLARDPGRERSLLP